MRPNFVKSLSLHAMPVTDTKVSFYLDFENTSGLSCQAQKALYKPTGILFLFHPYLPNVLIKKEQRLHIQSEKDRFEIQKWPKLVSL